MSLLRPLSCRLLVLVVLAAVASCSSKPSPVGPPQADADVEEPPPALDPEDSAQTAPAPKPVPQSPGAITYYSDAELQALGLAVERISPDLAIVCPPGDSKTYCTCIEPLECGEDCITFERNVSGFREALARESGATVSCEQAQVGTCDSFEYFHFEGDIHRNEWRVFGADGRLAAMRNSTDYPAFCGKRTMSRWIGGIPHCSKIAAQETICGRTEPPASPQARMKSLAGR